MVHFPKKTTQKLQGLAAHPGYIYAHALIKGVAHEFKNQ